MLTLLGAGSSGASAGGGAAFTGSGATGAWTGANGDYTETGTSGGKPAYTNPSGWWIWWDGVIFVAWVVDEIFEVIGPVDYTNPGDVPTPPLGEAFNNLIGTGTFILAAV